MEEKYSLQRQHSGIWRSLRSDGEFEEEEVWDVLKEKPPHYNNNTNNNNSYGVFKSKSKSSSSSSFVSLSVPRPLPSASKMIPKAISNNNITSSPSIESKLLQQSAPVHIPDWSKIYKNNNNKMKKNNNNKAHNRRVSRVEDYDDDSDDDDDDEDNEGDVNGEEDEDEDEEEDDDVCDVKLPPHEIIARRLARNQISSFSVFEGVGRTLKGRDLSKVRNAVLTKTGFLESL